MPNVSVIMGVYNCKDFNLLKKSVDSVIHQTYRDWEFIICNDGSTDHTLDMLREIEKTDPRIRVISYEHNRGLGAALNACLKEAQGNYIARQDDDDQSRPDRFEKQINFLDRNKKYAFVGCIADVYDDDGIWGEYKVAERPQKRDFYWNSPFMHPTVIVRKEVYHAVHGYRVAKETRRCEDIDLFMRMYAAGYVGYNIQEKLYIYKMINDPNKKYRPMKDRIDEAVVKWRGYKKLGIFFPKGILYVLKPIIIGIIPQPILYRIKKTQY